RMRSELSQGLDTNRFFDKNRGSDDKESLAAARRACLRGRMRDAGSAETRTGARTEACPGASASAGSRAGGKAGSREAETCCGKGHLCRRRAVRLRQVGSQARRKVETRRPREQGAWRQPRGGDRDRARRLDR